MFTQKTILIVESEQVSKRASFFFNKDIRMIKIEHSRSFTSKSLKNCSAFTKDYSFISL